MVTQRMVQMVVGDTVLHDRYVRPRKNYHMFPVTSSPKRRSVGREITLFYIDFKQNFK